MNIAKTTVEIVFDDQHVPIAVIPYNGRATVYLCQEAKTEELADLMKLLADSTPPTIIEKE